MSDRGAGLVYRGSIEKLHGAVVEVMRPCPCGRCQYTRSRGAGTRWTAVVVLGGFPDDLFHARAESFVGPDWFVEADAG